MHSFIKNYRVSQKKLPFEGFDAGVSINFKTWVFYKGWFPRFGFFISRPYAVFYKMKVVFYKKCTFYSFQLFLKPKKWFCQMWYCIKQNTGIFWNKYLNCMRVLHFKAVNLPYLKIGLIQKSQPLTRPSMEDMISDGILEVEARM